MRSSLAVDKGHEVHASVGVRAGCSRRAAGSGFEARINTIALYYPVYPLTQAREAASGA